jgi:hypothetical protein
MGKPNFSDEFKRDAVAQITERGYPVAEVSADPKYGLLLSDLGAAVLARKRKPEWKAR